MHAHALRTLGLPGTYEALETPLAHLADRLEAVRREYRGVNLTLPLKEKALELVDWAAPEAKAIGAVNTVLSLKGHLFGFNTDALGFLEALKAGGIPLQGPALVLGAGGAGRAVAFALKGVGLEVWVWNRTPRRAEALAEELGLEAVSLERAREARLLVNATSVGLNAPEETPPPCRAFPGGGGGGGPGLPPPLDPVPEGGPGPGASGADGASHAGLAGGLGLPHLDGPSSGPQGDGRGGPEGS
jgi:shikimate dehydrogenase